MSNNDYGISPEQYHAGLDKLWSALENVLYNGEKDVFTMCSDRIKKLEILAGQLLEMDMENFENLDCEAMLDAFDIPKPAGFLNDGLYVFDTQKPV